MSRRTILFGLLLAALAVTGCHTCHRQKCSAQRPCDSCSSYYPPPPRIRPVPVPAPAPAPPRQPPIARLDPPAQAGYLAPQNEAPPARQDPPPEGPPENGPNPKEPPDDFPPAGPPATLGPPQAVSPYRRDVARVPDELPLRANVPNQAPREDRTQPKGDDQGWRLNVNAAIPGVDSGLRPQDLGDVKWLAKKEFRAVLNLREPGTDDSKASHWAKLQGLQYHSLIASAATLDVDRYEDFVRIVNETKNHPLYVYDEKDGTVVGGLWYLYFRIEKKDDDATARRKAKKLGLDFDEDSRAHKDMVLAVQGVLAKLKP